MAKTLHHQIETFGSYVCTIPPTARMRDENNRYCPKRVHLPDRFLAIMHRTLFCPCGAATRTGGVGID